MTIDDHAIVTRLITEVQRLRDDPLVPSALQFAAPPWDAYTVVAALQGASRHPGLSDGQRTIVVGFARQIADLLIRHARASIGPDSAIEATLEMGFDPRYDRATDDMAL